MPIRPNAKIFRGTPRNLAFLARALNDGEVVAVPTETVYGLAGDALNENAVEKIFRAKGRPANDPLIVHLHSLKQLNQLAETNPAVEKIARAFWPGPLTIVLPKKPAVPDLVTSGRPSVAIRMPRHPLFRKLLHACGRPLAAPSANPFGYISPTSAAHVAESLGKKIHYILEGGDCAIGLESTILDLRDPKHPAILRPGAIERRAIERVLRAKVKPAAGETVKRTKAAIAPGLLARHYSPRTPIKLYDQLSEGRDGPPGRPQRQTQATVTDAPAVRPYLRSTEAYLYFRRPAEFAKGREPKNIFWLSEKGELATAAKNLFAKLRALDQGKWKQIRAERAPGQDALALAINDRLTRAAAKR
ncbi:MAG: L-threonylcarbamoyladenylate synthase [Nibricoccus sp.]